MNHLILLCNGSAFCDRFLCADNGEINNINARTKRSDGRRDTGQGESVAFE